MRGAAALVVLIAATFSPPTYAHQTSPSQTIAFVDVNVVPMNEERVVPHQTVLIREQRIVGLGPRDTLRIPGGALRVAAHGEYLLPGLADMHAHIFDDTGFSELSARSELLLYVATGVTLVRNMSGSPRHLEYRRRVAAGEIVGPRIFTTTPILDGPHPVWPFAVKVSDPAQVDALVDAFVRDGYDQIKVYNGLSNEVYATLFNAAARDHIRVVGHVPFSVGIDAALAAGQYSIEHLRGYDFDFVRPQALLVNGGRNAERFSSWQRMSEERMRDLVRKTVASGAWNCPTFVIDEMMSSSEARARLARDPRMRFVRPAARADILSNDLDAMFPPEASAALRASIPVRYHFLKLLSDAGAGLLVGTDSPLPYLVPSFTVIDEIRDFVNAGLTPYQALRASTTDPARFLGIAADSGTIAPGKRADLILVRSNPLEDVGALWKLSGVVLNGRWLSRDELQGMLEHLAASYPPAAPRASAY